MKSKFKCPRCSQVMLVSSQQFGKQVRCAGCQGKLAIPLPGSSEYRVAQPARQQPVHSSGSRDMLAPRPGRSSSMDNESNSFRRGGAKTGSRNQVLWILGALGGGGCLVTCLVIAAAILIIRQTELPNFEGLQDAISQNANLKKENLRQAREGFETQLRQGTLWDHDDRPAHPPNPIQLVKYQSPVGPMSGYVNRPMGKQGRRPAIIWIFGGFDNGIGRTAWVPQPTANDQSARAFSEQGLVMMYPSFRGGNDNPGRVEGFMGEVDDVLAAADYLAEQDFVDPDRIYLGGHSTGGTMVLLTAASSDRFRACFAFGPVDDVSGYGNDLPFMQLDPDELRLRNPIEWLHAIKRPVFAIEGERGNAYSLTLMEQASRNPNLHFYVIPGTDHFGVLAPVTNLIARKVSQDNGPTCNIQITPAELAALFNE